MALRSQLNGLALCAGVAGLELGIKLACPAYTTIAYVEGEAYAAANLVSLMERGWLDSAPVWSDLRTFDARAWRGVVDIVTAGFPCQPFSAAGKQQHEDDERHLWPHIARIVGECEPAFVFLENVALRAFVEPWRDLRGLGFNLSRPFACTAAELGAGHLRRRVFVLAYRDGESCEMGSARRDGMQNACRDVAMAGNAEHQRRVQPEGSERAERRRAEDSASSDTSSGRSRPAGSGSKTSDVEESTSLDANRWTGGSVEWPGESVEAQGSIALDAAGIAEREQADEANAEPGSIEAWRESARADWWLREPELERVVRRCPNRVDRDRALGNIVVPQQTAFAFASLMREISADKP